MSPHGIPRTEWERRFKERIAEVAVITSDELDACVYAELQSWPQQDNDWVYLLPEDAADEQMSYWD